MPPLALKQTSRQSFLFAFLTAWAPAEIARDDCSNKFGLVNNLKWLRRREAELRNEVLCFRKVERDDFGLLEVDKHFILYSEVLEVFKFVLND